MASVLERLQQVLNTKITDPRKLATKANDLKDDEWRRLGADAQKWVNAVLEEIEKAYDEKREPQLPPLDGLTEQTDLEEHVANRGGSTGTAPAKAAKPASKASQKPKAASKPKAVKAEKASGRTRAGINSNPKDTAVACREGSKQAKLVDLLSRPQGATFDELHAAMNSKQFSHMKPWSPSTTRSALHWDVHSVKGYGVRTEFMDQAQLLKTAEEIHSNERRRAAKALKGDDATLAVYHLVLPRGLKAPLPHTPRKTESAAGTSKKKAA